MKKLSEVANELIHADLVKQFASERNISLTEAQAAISNMSFIEYHNLFEAGATITPPSGNTIGPTSSAPDKQKQNVPQKTTPSWSGKGPVQMGMQVGMLGVDNKPMPGIVSRVDTSTQGVVVKDPVSGKETTLNMKDLQPFALQATQDQAVAEAGFKNSYSEGDRVDTPMGFGTIMAVDPNVSVTDKVSVKLDDPSMAGPDGEFKNTFTLTTSMLKHLGDGLEEELARIRQLAGIKENCSAGATGAGAIAVAPAAMGKMQKRQYPEESLKAEYTPKGPAKTIIGDTKPNQASGKLSADLAASGKRTATRPARKKK